MKTAQLVLGLVLFIAITSFTNAQIYTERGVPLLLKKSKSDSISKIERLAALEFHKLINAYRKSNKLSALEWNETLWIATRNHNIWMSHANKLNHHQTSNTKYFTGLKPGDRYDFAAGGESNNSWSGENALYNYSIQGKSIKEIAINIAKTSFIQWQNSPGHNENMLGKRHLMHGVAFTLDNNMVWGTDLFSSSNRSKQPSYKAPVYAKIKKTRTKRFSSFKMQQIISEEMLTQLPKTLNLKPKNIKMKKKDNAAKKARKLLSKKIKTPYKQEVLLSETKVTTTKGVLGLFSKEVHTYSLVLLKNLNDINIDSLPAEMVALVTANQNILHKSKLDIGVALRKRKNTVKITLVSILSHPKSIVPIF